MDEHHSLYGDLGEESEYFAQASIPTIDDLKELLQQYIENNKNWTSPTYISNEKASLVAHADKNSNQAYLHLNLPIGSGGKAIHALGISLLSPINRLRFIKLTAQMKILT